MWRRLTPPALWAVRGLLGSRRASVATYVAVAILPLIGIVGLAVDTARAFHVRSRLSSALDAAALAGGRAMFKDDRDQDIQAFFDANFPPGYMGTTVSGPEIAADEANERLSLQATATLPTTFMRLFEFDTIDVAAETEVTRETRMLDVVMAIDVSGSMNESAGNGMSRIAAAKNAASILVNILFGDDAAKDLLKIGLVPWAGKVNIARNDLAFDSSLIETVPKSAFINPLTGAVQEEVYRANNSPVDLLSEPPSTWKGCVYARYLSDGDATNDADRTYANVTLGGLDWFGWQPVGAEGEPVSGFASRCQSASDAGSSEECTPCPAVGVTALQNEKQVMLDAIAEISIPTFPWWEFIDFYTNIPTGLAWAWRVLMPPAPFTEADPNPPIQRQQAIVLLTDGENTRRYGDAFNRQITISSQNARTREVAENIKAQGVLIYTIQFANGSGALADLMKDVATEPKPPFYNFAPDGDALEKIFKEVANNLSVLRISR